MKKKFKVLLVGCLTVIVAIGIALLSGCSAELKLNKEEKALFTLLTETIITFKNPQSVRIISGTLTYEDLSDEETSLTVDYEDYQRGYYIAAFLRISANNSFGASISDNYLFCYSEGEPTCLSMREGDIGEDYCYKTDDFDYAAVNAALEEYWENYL